MARCHAGYEYTRQFRTTMEMWYAVEWYRDVLYHHDYGTMINSGAFTGTPGDVAKAKVTEWLQEQGMGRFDVKYRLHDWLISRQRYWGAPIPMIYCEQCGVVPVPYENLPVILPTDAKMPPTGENALKFHEGFLHTTCPQCGGPARRETDTMDTFMCSSWYQYAYVSPYWKAGEKLSPDDLPWDRERATTGCRSTSTPAGPSMPRCTCCTRASSPRRWPTWASSTSASRCCGCSTRASSWGLTATA